MLMDTKKPSIADRSIKIDSKRAVSFDLGTQNLFQVVVVSFFEISNSHNPRSEPRIMTGSAPRHAILGAWEPGPQPVTSQS